METESSPSNTSSPTNKICKPAGLRECPQCELLTIYGMPGGRDAVCTNCGYKDPCCTDS